jgi:hypothetical protein
MTTAKELFPDGHSSYYLIPSGGPAQKRPSHQTVIKQMTIFRMTSSLFMIEFRGACVCINEAWINRVGWRGLERKAFALRRYLRRSAAHNSKVCWADKPGAFSGNAY